MSDATPVYLHLRPSDALPEVGHLAPFRAVVVVDAFVTPDWQAKVSRWLVQSGCLYVMAWGHDCSSWDDSVDMANLDEFHYDDIPEDRFVMTTWHDDVPLAEVLAFCKGAAVHPVVELKHAVLLHIAEESDGASMLKTYADA